MLYNRYLLLCVVVVQAIISCSLPRFVAHALQYLKSRGIAHMDLKPQNLLLSSQTKPILKIGGYNFIGSFETML